MGTDGPPVDRRSREGRIKNMNTSDLITIDPEVRGGACVQGDTGPGEVTLRLP